MHHSKPAILLFAALLAGFSGLAVRVAVASEAYFTFRVGYGFSRLPVRVHQNRQPLNAIASERGHFSDLNAQGTIGSLARFSRDPTLRRGDVVVTCEGIFTYRGPTGRAGRLSDFAPVGEMSFVPALLRDLSLQQRTEQCQAAGAQPTAMRDRSVNAPMPVLDRAHAPPVPDAAASHGRASALRVPD